MRKFLLAVVLLNLVLGQSAFARDDVGDYSIQEAMNVEKVKEAIGSDIKFYFGSQNYGSPSKTFGELSTNKKTNGFKKSDTEACQWAFASAMVSLRDRALREGGNAVVNIKSNYKNNTTSSSETFQCGAGNIMVGVALLGTVVKL